MNEASRAPSACFKFVFRATVVEDDTAVPEDRATPPCAAPPPGQPGARCGCDEPLRSEDAIPRRPPTPLREILRNAPLYDPSSDARAPLSMRELNAQLRDAEVGSDRFRQLRIQQEAAAKIIYEEEAAAIGVRNRQRERQDDDFDKGRRCRPPPSVMDYGADHDGYPLAWDHWYNSSSDEDAGNQDETASLLSRQARKEAWWQAEHDSCPFLVWKCRCR